MSNSRSGTGDEQRSHMQPMYIARTKSKDVIKVYGIVSGQAPAWCCLFSGSECDFHLHSSSGREKPVLKASPGANFAKTPTHEASSGRNWHWRPPQLSLPLLAWWARTLSKRLLAVKTPSWQECSANLKVLCWKSRFLYLLCKKKK